MSCSKDKATKYLLDRQLVKPNMELYTSLPTNRLTTAIDKLTQLAKTKYQVDMGPLFSLKFRDIQVGDYLTMGRSSVVTKIRVEPNDAAFDAIDRSPSQEKIQQEERIRQLRREIDAQVTREYIQIQEEGNFVVSEDGEVSVPSFLPKINIQC